MDGQQTGRRHMFLFLENGIGELDVSKLECLKFPNVGLCCILCKSKGDVLCFESMRKVSMGNSKQIGVGFINIFVFRICPKSVEHVPHVLTNNGNKQI